MPIIEITSVDAWSSLCSKENTVLIDVRTPYEWQRTGLPCVADIIPGKLLMLPVYVSALENLEMMMLNLKFNIKLMEQIPDKNTSLFFLCNLGIRSKISAAIAEKLGYNNCYNISDGINGNSNGVGWKHNNLPWKK